jgi:hypothetical protein
VKYRSDVIMTKAGNGHKSFSFLVFNVTQNQDGRWVADIDKCTITVRGIKTTRHARNLGVKDALKRGVDFQRGAGTRLSDYDLHEHTTPAVLRHFKTANFDATPHFFALTMPNNPIAAARKGAPKAANKNLCRTYIMQGPGKDVSFFLLHVLPEKTVDGLPRVRVEEHTIAQDGLRTEFTFILSADAALDVVRERENARTGRPVLSLAQQHRLAADGIESLPHYKSHPAFTEISQTPADIALHDLHERAQKPGLQLKPRKKGPPGNAP